MKLASIRYPLCVLVSAMAACGFVSNFSWPHHQGQVNALQWIGYYDYATRARIGLWLWCDPLLLAFLYAAIAVIAWHYRKVKS
jgi:hypothetical protein